MQKHYYSCSGMLYNVIYYNSDGRKVFTLPTVSAFISLNSLKKWLGSVYIDLVPLAGFCMRLLLAQMAHFYSLS